jgi:hypothetical protein
MRTLSYIRTLDPSVRAVESYGYSNGTNTLFEEKTNCKECQISGSHWVVLSGSVLKHAFDFKPL